jgi:hypothetical protein
MYPALGGGVSDEPYMQSSSTFTFTDQDSVVGRFRLTPSKPVVKAPMVSELEAII